MKNGGIPTVISVDLLTMPGLEGVKFIQGDIEDEAVKEQVSQALDYNKADLIISDAVPDFIGDKFIDHMKSCYLNKEIVLFCD